jgi:two-component system, cell cycle response regulator
MNLSCETIISENEKLKLTDLEKSCLNIYDYLKLHHHINYLTIDIKKDNHKENLFEHNDGDFDYLINTSTFKQNANTDVVFNFLSKDKEEFEKIKNDLTSIKMSLQIFSQSLFNKYMEKTINEMSLIDHITGSYNRHYLDNYASNLLSLSNREQKKIAFVK